MQAVHSFVLHTSCLNCNTLSSAMLRTLAPALHDNIGQAASSHTVNVCSSLCVAAVDGLTLYTQQQRWFHTSKSCQEPLINVTIHTSLQQPLIDVTIRFKTARQCAHP